MSGFSRYVQVCHCGHDKSSHYKDSETCLGMLCDCTRYVDRDDPKPQAMKAAPPVPVVEVEEECPPTLPMFPAAAPAYPHAVGCTCAVCAYMYGAP